MTDILIRVHRLDLQYHEEIDGYGMVLGDVPPGAQVAVHDPTVIQDKENAQATVVIVEPYHGATVTGADDADA